MRTQAAVILLVSVLSACGGSQSSPAPASSAIPGATAPTPVSPSPAPPALTGNRLSGTVLERTTSGTRNVAGGRLFVWNEDQPFRDVEVGRDGQYVIPDLVTGSARLVWIADPGSTGFHQPCPANVIIAAPETNRDIEVARLGFSELVNDPPIVSGHVFETTTQGRRPLPHTRVLYISGPRGYDAYTETDADGKFAFCRVPAGRAQVGAGDCNDQVFLVPTEVHGNTDVDIDLTGFYASCPGTVRR